MRAIRSSGNRTTEQKLVSLMRASSLTGWHLHPRGFPGNPDLMVKEKRVAVFVDGCFWHGCPTCGHIPNTNRRYWKEKLARNKARDRRVGRKLRSEGIRVLRIWECQLRRNQDSCLKRIARAIQSV